MMAGKREQRIEELFQAAVNLAEPQRDAFLREQCDDETRAEVKKLLDFDQVKGGGLTADQSASLCPTQDAPISPGCEDQPKTPSRATTGLINHGRFLPGSILSDRYRIVGMLGQGGMGEVYRADDLELGQSVALKFLPKRLADDPRSLERFRGEVRLSRQVSHPNVCRVYDIGQIEGQWFLSMEYVDGEDLAQLLKRVGRFNAERATELARELCMGLQAAHEKAVLHRDLKPANIMIDGRGKLLITDFGLAEIADEVRGDDIRSGTPAYMSPEQLAGREVTQRSDVYSLGIILHEIYTGKPVWEADSMAELFEKRESSNAPTPISHAVELDPAVERTIRRCLEHDPDRRPSNAISVLAALPGGDPLAAALAAGETPSPTMVANSGGSSSLSIKVAAVALLGTLVALFLNIWCSDISKRINQSPLENEPAVLLNEIKEMITDEFGYEPGKESAHGFLIFPELSDEEIGFWYRQRPAGRGFVMNAFWGEVWGEFSWSRPGFQNPPQDMPGELSVILSGNKRLLYMSAVPEQALVTERISQPSEQTARWSDWFTPERTGFYLPTSPGDLPESEDSRETIPVLEIVEDRWWRPEVVYDSLGVWRGYDEDGASFLVEAASYRGQPVYFRKLLEDDSEEIFSNAAQDGKGGPLLGIVLLAIVFALACVWYNLWTGRGDRRGAFRFASYIFTLNIIALVCLSRLNVGIEFAYHRVFVIGISCALFSSARLWVWYLAFEPSVRRIWPQILTSFSRLLEGRVWDPLVGKHLLFGILFGAVGALSPTGNQLLHDWFDRETYLLPQTGLLALSGLRESIGTVATLHTKAIVLALFSMLLLLICRIIARSEQIAFVASAATFSIVMTILVGGSFMLTILSMLVFFGLMYFVLVRFGLLSLVAFYSAFLFLGRFPMTGDTSKWFFGHGVFIAIVTLAVAICASYTSVGGAKGLKQAAR